MTATRRCFLVCVLVLPAFLMPITSAHAQDPGTIMAVAQGVIALYDAIANESDQDELLAAVRQVQTHVDDLRQEELVAMALSAGALYTQVFDGPPPSRGELATLRSVLNLALFSMSGRILNADAQRATELSPLFDYMVALSILANRAAGASLSTMREVYGPALEVNQRVLGRRECYRYSTGGMPVIFYHARTGVGFTAYWNWLQNHLHEQGTTSILATPYYQAAMESDRAILSADPSLCPMTNDRLLLRWTENGPPDNFAGFPPIRVNWGDIRTIMPGLYCEHITEPSDGGVWNDNWLCGTHYWWANVYWSSDDPLEDLICTRWLESADDDTWDDNYLCATRSLNSHFQFRFSSRGSLQGWTCVRTTESGDDGGTWYDNYFCYRPR